MNKPDFVYVVYIRTTPEAVWQALTTPEFTAKYWGGRRIESDWRTGAPVRHVRPDGGVDWLGEVIEAEAPRLLTYTFHMTISEAHAADRPSRVTFLIEPVGDVVKLTLKHEHVEDVSPTRETTSHGWPAIMSSLKSLLESGSPLPFAGLGFGPKDAKHPGIR